MSIKARLKRLEKKIAATEQGGAIFNLFAGEPIFRMKQRNGAEYCFPLHSSEEFAAMALAQQNDLMARLTEYGAAIDSAETEPPALPPGADDVQAPLKDGQKRAKYIFTTDAKGREIQLEVATGIRTLV